MSAKNRPEAKKLRRLERALRKGRLPKWIDLIQWAQDHGHAQTAGAARKLIVDDRIRYASHPLGKKIIEFRGPHLADPAAAGPAKIQVLEPRVPAHMQNSITVTDN